MFTIKHKLDILTVENTLGSTNPQRGYTKIMNPRHMLWALMGLFVLLGLTYMQVTPVLESPDESSHLQVIHYISTHHKLTHYRLPEMTAKTGEGMAWLVSYHEEPLYYAPPLYHTLGTLLTFWSPMDDLEARLIPNPAWERGAGRLHAVQTRGTRTYSPTCLVRPGARVPPYARQRCCGCSPFYAVS